MNQFRTLKADEIECRVSKVYDWGVSLLLYKTARTDMDLLDEAFGAENWESDYKEIKGNLFCGIGVYNSKMDSWTWKWDCGIESREDNGNEKKGEASDAMKRAGFKWGIGRELYTAPRIIIKCETKDKNGKVIPHYFEVSSITYDSQRRVSSLEIVENGNTVFKWAKSENPKVQETSDDMLKDQILALAKGDLTRVNTFIAKFLGEDKNLSNLEHDEYVKVKVAIARQVQQA